MAMTKAERERMQRLSAAFALANSERGMAEAKRNEALTEMDRAVARAANLRWHAVYGAAVAAQALARIVEGRGPADDETMAGYVEEATAIADQSEQLFPVAKGGDDG